MPEPLPQGKRQRLSEATKAEIRRLHAIGGFTHQQIADQAGVSKGVIGRTIDPAKHLQYARKSAQTMARKRREHPLYGGWERMRQRCSDPNVPNWKDYGGRGITVAECFDLFEVYERYVYGLPPCAHGFSGNPATGGRCPHSCTLDRKYNDGPYAPGNLAWATRKEQNMNRRVVYLKGMAA
jgi:hypothetical protein